MYNTHPFEQVRKCFRLDWLPDVSAGKVSPFWCIVAWSYNNYFFLNCPNFNWFFISDLENVASVDIYHILSHLLGTLWICSLSFPVFTASCGQKAIGEASCHIHWIFQDFMWCWWFGCVMLLPGSLSCTSPFLVLTKTVCLFCSVPSRKCLKPQNSKPRNSTSTWANKVGVYMLKRTLLLFLLLSCMRVLGPVASFLYNKVWFYAVIFLPVRALTEAWSSVWVLVHVMELKEV